MKASDTDGEVNETMKKKHVTMDDRPSSRSSTVTDIRNRYYKQFSFYHPDKYLMINSHSYVN